MVDEQLKTLAAAARISKTTYDLVIPFLFQKIRFTANNKDNFWYGLTLCDIERQGKSDASQQY